MMSPGEVVEATVYRTEDYGVFLKSDGADLFVHLPELTWEHGPPASRRGLLNTTVLVKLLRYNDRKKEWAASMKKARPERNPYRRLLEYGAEAVLSGRVYFRSGDAVFIEFDSGAWGRASVSFAQRQIKTGDMVDVSIAELDPEEGKLILKLR